MKKNITEDFLTQFSLLLKNFPANAFFFFSLIIFFTAIILGKFSAVGYLVYIMFKLQIFIICFIFFIWSLILRNCELKKLPKEITLKSCFAVLSTLIIIPIYCYLIYLITVAIGGLLAKIL